MYEFRFEEVAKALLEGGPQSLPSFDELTPQKRDELRDTLFLILSTSADPKLAMQAGIALLREDHDDRGLFHRTLLAISEALFEGVSDPEREIRPRIRNSYKKIMDEIRSFINRSGSGQRRRDKSSKRRIASEVEEAGEELPWQELFSQLAKTVFLRPRLAPEVLKFFADLSETEVFKSLSVVAPLKESVDNLLAIFIEQGTPRPFGEELYLTASRKLGKEFGEWKVIYDVLRLGLLFYPYSERLLMRTALLTRDCIGPHSERFYECASKLVQHYPDNLAAKRLLMESLAEDDEWEEVLSLADQVLSRLTHRKVLELKARALTELDEHKKALKVYNQLLSDYEPQVSWLIGRAKVFAHLDMDDEAMADLDRAKELSPEDEEIENTRRYIQERRLFLFEDEDDLFGSRSGSAFQVEEIPEQRFSDIGGLSQVKEAIRERIEYPLRYPELSEKYGKSVGGGILLFGPPGCGKTMLARAIAGECQVSFISVSLSQLLDKWVGNTEKAIARLFHEARTKAPTLIFFDELDALGGARSEGQSWERKFIGQLLMELDGIRGQNRQVVVMGATNAPWNIDIALRRPGRFGTPIYVPPPDFEARKEILSLYLNKKPLVADDIDLDELARRTELFSAAALQQLVEEAASIPWKEAIRTGQARPITMADLIAALSRRKPDLAEWEKLLDRYQEFAALADQKQRQIGFRRRLRGEG